MNYENEENILVHVSYFYFLHELYKNIKIQRDKFGEKFFPNKMQLSAQKINLDPERSILRL
jgi:hypothetical protein